MSPNQETTSSSNPRDEDLELTKAAIYLAFHRDSEDMPDNLRYQIEQSALAHLGETME
jgi:hypothetical protein